MILFSVIFKLDWFDFFPWVNLWVDDLDLVGIIMMVGQEQKLRPYDNTGCLISESFAS